MPTYKVCLKTVVNIFVENVEAETPHEALVKVDSTVSQLLYEHFSGGGRFPIVESSWGGEHTAAIVDEVDEKGEMIDEKSDLVYDRPENGWKLVVRP